MTTYRIADRRRWTSVSNSLVEDGSISFRARGLLIWLLSKPDGWTVKSETIAAGTTEGRDAIRASLRELEAAGYIRREKLHGPDGKWVTVSSIFESPETGFQASENQASVSQALTTNDGEASTDQQSSLRSEGLDQQVARDYWEWYVAEHNDLRPTIEFLALRSVAKRLLKSGHQPDEIVDAMKTAKAWTAKALGAEITRKRQEATDTPIATAIPHSLVRAFAKAQPFFDRHLTGRGHADEAAAVKRLTRELMQVCARLMKHQGYDTGETMIRLAIALRGIGLTDADDLFLQLLRAPCPRFEGELDDYPDAMERAFTNRMWNVR